MTQTQARSSQSMRLQLTPMQLPEGLAAEELSLSPLGLGGSSPSRLNLVVRPGELSEMVVQVENLSDDSPLRLDLNLEGGIPPTWWHWSSEAGIRPGVPLQTELSPRQQMDASLCFSIESDYLEQAIPETSANPTLKLNYGGTLIVSGLEENTNRRQIESARFQLYIRPRSLYLDFLPAIYRDIDFVGRFLKIFEQAFEPAVQTLDSLWAHLDPLTAPAAFLPFLAHWVGWSANFQLDAERQRILIRNALQIYRWRGTRRGLRFYLHLATGLPLDEEIEDETQKHIGIQEFFSRGCLMGTSKLGEDARLGRGRPYYFVVHLRPDPAHVIDEALVRQVIEQEKPAFCTYNLRIDRCVQT